MKLTILGTGHAVATKCYNTCFALEDAGRVFLVDGGGGNGLLVQLERAGIPIPSIHEIFVTHRHTDHILGIVWMLRMLSQAIDIGAMEGDVTIYAHDEVTQLLALFEERLLSERERRHLGTRIHLQAVENGQICTVLGRPVTFFDIGSTKAKQFGFRMEYESGRALVCCGDEPYRDCEERYARGANWLLHEAFCLYEDAARFHPYEKHHSTVKDACETASRLGVRNLLLYHTEDTDLSNRKARYTAEGRRFFSGNLYIPDDLESFIL